MMVGGPRGAWMGTTAGGHGRGPAARRHPTPTTTCQIGAASDVRHEQDRRRVPHHHLTSRSRRLRQQHRRRSHATRSFASRAHPAPPPPAACVRSARWGAAAQPPQCGDGGRLRRSLTGAMTGSLWGCGTASPHGIVTARPRLSARCASCCRCYHRCGAGRVRRRRRHSTTRGIHRTNAAGCASERGARVARVRCHDADLLRGRGGVGGVSARDCRRGRHHDHHQ